MLVRALDDGHAAGARAAARRISAIAGWPARLIFLLLLAAPLTAALAGCATAPVPELQTYAAAYEQVRTGGHLLLDEISPFVSAEQAADATLAEGESAPVQDCSLGAEGIPPCFDPNLALGEAGLRANESRDISVRRAALDVVMEYNTVLLALAEGKSAESVTQRFGELQSLVSTAAAVAGAPTAGISTLVPVAFELLSGLAVRFETARANGTIRESVVASRADIGELLTLLIEDTPVIYDIYVNGHGLELARLNKAKNTARIARQTELQADLERQEQAYAQRIRDFHASVGAYTRVLAATDSALGTLVRAAETQGTSIPDITAVVRETAEIKSKAEIFFNLIRTVRAATPAGSPS